MVYEYDHLEIGYLNLSELYILTKELDKGISIIKKGITIKSPPNVGVFFLLSWREGPSVRMFWNNFKSLIIFKPYLVVNNDLKKNNE